MRLAHSLLLYKHFRQPSKLIDCGDSPQYAGWTAALQEPIEKALEELIRQGHLLPCEDLSPLAPILELKLSVVEIQERLRAKHLKLSGRKSELAPRLAANDADGAISLIKELRLYVCSDSGHELAQTYAVRKQSASNAAFLAFENAEYTEATKIAERFDLELGFPKVPGFDVIHPPEWFRFLSEAKPSILKPLPVQLIEELRKEVALAALGLGQTRSKKWSAQESTYLHLERKFAENMLCFATHHSFEISHALQLGVKRFKVCGGGNVNSKPDAVENSCAFCRSLNGTICDIDDVPELPHPNCTHLYGCRCWARPLFKDALP